MIINWYTYILQQLPPRMQHAELVEFVRVLIGEIAETGNAFDLFLADANYKVNVNASTLALEKLISYELDAIAVITELDGLPFDFLVTVHGLVDDSRLKTLINKYKLADKSYTFSLGEVGYTANFKNYACEDIIVKHFATFKDYFCEDDGNNEILVDYAFSPDYSNFEVTAIAEKPVVSDVMVTGKIFKNVAGNLIELATFGTLILDGQTEGTESVPNPTAADYAGQNITTDPLVTIGEAAANPVSDDQYNYVIIT